MTGGCIDRLRMAGCRPGTSAVVWRAQMRAAFDDLSRDLHVDSSWVIAVGLAAAARVLWNTASFRSICLMLWRIPVGCPFPDVANHVLQSIPVRRECTHRRGALETIGIGILARKISLPGVC